MKTYILALGLLFGCSDSTKLNPEAAQQQADSFIHNLFPAENINGPICMPEAVIEDMTQCTYSYKNLDGTFKVGTILCGNTGCREGEAPVTVSQNMMPQNGSIDNDWLFWYALWSSGSTTHQYHHWYNTTPVTHRSSYYSFGHSPSPQSVSYYHDTHGTSVKQNTTTKYSTKSTSGTTTSPKTTSPKTTSSRTTSTSKPTTSSPKPTTSRSSRSSGFGSSRRSSGVRSSSRRR